MVEALANDQPTDSSGLTRNAADMPDLIKSSKASDDLAEARLSVPIIELAQNAIGSASTTDAQVHDNVQTKTELPCHFMRLPPEIRVEIYKHVFSEVLEKTEHGEESRSYYDRRRIMCRHIKTALAMVHTSHTIRIEALPVCQQLTDTVSTSVVRDLDQLRPEWRTWSIYSVAAALKKLQKKGQRRYIYKRCRELEARYDDVCEVGRALQLVGGGLHREHGDVERCEGKE